MTIKQVRKFISRKYKIIDSTPKEKIVPDVQEISEEKKTTNEKPVGKNKNKSEKNKEDMTLEQIEKAETLAQNFDMPKVVKIVKKDRGLIERTESSKIVLTEDNRQVLND